MRRDLEIRLAGIIDKAGLFLALLGLLAVVAFPSILIERGVDHLFGWTYPFQSVGDFLHLKAPYGEFATWDRSVLFLVAGFLALWVASSLDGLAEWLKTEPERRRYESDKRKAAARNAAREEEEKRQAQKAARKPMSGWRRLWIVLSVLFGAAAFVIANDVYSRGSAFIEYNGDDAAFWQRARSDPALSDCNWFTAKVDSQYPVGRSYLVSCENADPWFFATLWAFLPAFLMAAVGLIVRWVYRGFRRVEA